MPTSSPSAAPGMAPLRTVLVSDTTLRDGEQMPGCFFHIGHKLQIAQALVAAGVRSIDIGFPGAGPHQFEACSQLAQQVDGAILSALCRAHPADIDAAARALAPLPRHRRAISLFITTSELARRRKLRLSDAEMLARVTEMVQLARASGFALVNFTAEDASRTELPFLSSVYATAMRAGATSLGYADTVGICTPEFVSASMAALRTDAALAQAVLGVHFHNDLGLAVANTLAAVKAGVQVVQCTVNGIGERAGNAALEEVALALSLHPGLYQARSSVLLQHLRPLSALVSQASGLPVPSYKPVVGSGLFVTAAGIHQDGLDKDPDLYLPYPPALVGETGFSFQLNHHSGKAALRHVAQGLNLPCTEADIDLLLAHLKRHPGVGLRPNLRQLQDLLAQARQDAATPA